MKIKLLLVAFAVLAIAVNSFGQETGTFTDSRDGQTYKTVKIGTQTWLAQNLNYKIKESYCYNFDSCECAKYGRFYNHHIQDSICPKGWHIPSITEWEILLNYLGGTKVAADKMKEIGSIHWDNTNTSTNSSGFSALGVGFCNPHDVVLIERNGSQVKVIGRNTYAFPYFEKMGECAAWLTYNDQKKPYVFYLSLFGVNRFMKAKMNLYYPIRCIKD